MSVPTLDGISAEQITTERISTRLLSSGDSGDAVVFVHGNVSSATFWEDVMLALPDGYRGLAYDQRGYGDADATAKIDATKGMEDLSEDLKALIDYLELESAHLVGHSAGGSVLWRFMMDYPAMCKSVTLVNPGSPLGFGGTMGLEGTPNAEDHAGSGGGTVNGAFVELIDADDRSDAQGSPRNILQSFYGKAPFVHEREEDLLSSMLSTHTGPKDYPGNFLTSANWPGVSPGTWGMVNALSKKYLKDIANLYDVEPKPPVLWVVGAEDQIVSDNSMFDFATLGKLGLIPNYPGEESIPPQPMVSQTRHVLQTYAQMGGQYEEVIIEDTGHSPYLEKPDAFNMAFHRFLSAHS
ncbi:MAG: alpha/beta hydrolase [Chloroflexota bacterium]